MSKTKTKRRNRQDRREQTDGTYERHCTVERVDGDLLILTASNTRSVLALPLAGKPAPAIGAAVLVTNDSDTWLPISWRLG